MSDSAANLLQKHQANISRLAQTFGFLEQTDFPRDPLSKMMEIETPFDIKKLQPVESDLIQSKNSFASVDIKGSLQSSDLKQFFREENEQMSAV
jgi:hypothetical protein